MHFLIMNGDLEILLSHTVHENLDFLPSVKS